MDHVATVRFRAVEREDLPILRDWRTDLMLAGVVRQWRHLNMINQENWLSKVTKSNRNIMFAFYDEGAILGVAGLTYCDWIRRSSEASIYVGDRSARSRGYGAAALKELCRYGFDQLGLNRIYAEIFEFNKASVVLFEKSGFRQEGIREESHFYQGRFWNAIMVRLLKREWDEITKASS